MEDLQMNNLTGIEKKIYDYFFSIAALIITGEMIFFRVEKMPIQAEICKAIGVASPKTYRSYLEKMVSEGILKLDEQKRVIIECPLKIDKKVISFINNAFIKSSVNVELEVRTRLESVDMEADSTRTITIPISISGSAESIVGIMVSQATEPSAAACTPEIWLNPPRK